MRKLLFMGKPGVGKGTQAKLLRKYGIQSLSTGNLIRNSDNLEIVEYRKKGYVEGKFLSDKTIFKLIEKNLPKNSGYILDGAIRTMGQAKYALKKGLIKEVIYFSLNDSKAKKRILERNQGRTDDTQEIVDKRLKEYKKKTEPVLKYLKENFEFHKVDASPSVKKIHEEVKRALGI